MGAFSLNTMVYCEDTMSRVRMRKGDLLTKIYKLKTDLYNGTYDKKEGQWHEGAHHALNKVLEHLQEYSE